MFERAMAQSTVPTLAVATSLPDTRWFAPYGCVADRDDVTQVFVGGTLIAQFDPDDRDRGPRNVLLVTLAKVPTMHLGHLAAAFEISEEYLRELRRLEEAQGLASVLKPAAGGKWRITDEKRAELHALFEAGWNVSDTTRRQRRGKSRVSRATVSREWHRWNATRESAAIAAPIATAITTVAEQLTLFSASVSSSIEAPAVSETRDPSLKPATVEDNRPAADDEAGAVVTLKSRPVVGGQLVQHVGAWIALALAKREGLHEEVEALGGSGDNLSIALDATIVSLAVGQRTVEGVRRLQTPSAPELLRADHAPTASAVRRRLWDFAKDHGAALMARMSERCLDAARGDDAPAVFYIDNHLRP